MEILFLLSKKQLDALDRGHLLTWWRGVKYFEEFEGNKSREKDFNYIETSLIKFITFARGGDLEGVGDVCKEIDNIILNIESNKL